MRLSNARTATLVLPALLIAVAALAADDKPKKKSRAEHDALAEARHSARKTEAGDLQRSGRDMQVEERLGVPTFVWAGKPGAAMSWDGKGKQAPAAAARRHLGVYAKLWDLKPQDVEGARLADVQDTGAGAVVAKFRQEVDGVEVFRDELTIVMDRELRAVALSGYIPPAEMAAPSFSLSAEDAIAQALSDFAETTIGAGAVSADDATNSSLSAEDRGKYSFYNVATGDSAALTLTQPVRAKQVLYHLPDTLEAAYYVEVAGQTPGEESTDSAAYAYVISAVDGRVLFRHDLTASDSFTYRVWADTSGTHQPYDGPNGTGSTPHPTGVPDGFQPPFVPSNLVTLQNGPISTNDPWLPAGATETVGNNVDAYVDLGGLDGFTPGPDFRANTTSPGVFDRTYDPSLQPNASADQQKAAITTLFYLNNWLHDWYYDAGFDEAAGNAQANNFGRGGLGNDSIKAEAQDFSGTDNANMQTPSDGARPTMQMYVFNGLTSNDITVNTRPLPSGLPAVFGTVGTAAFGPQSFVVTGDVVRANDGVASPGGSLTDGCEPFAANSLTGKIVLIDRGGAAPVGSPVACGFALKVQNATAGGAIGAIIANVATSGTPTVPANMGGAAGVCVTPTACIGVLSLNFANGELLRTAVAAGAVNVTLSRPAALNRDGTIDGQIVAHEWGHYLTNRLVGNAVGLNNVQGRGMGEGWGDFNALLLTARPEDALAPNNANWNGVYAMAGYSTARITPVQNFYFGIRRLPYSSDFTKNALTFKHISNGVPLPTGIPILPNASANSEVHNAGEVWASMLWEAYTSLLRDTLGPAPRLTFDEARDRMRRYLVASLKMTPNSPTFLEARDALLTAAYLNDLTDGHRFCAAFARRGAGIDAVAPDRFSTTNAGVVESFACADDLAFVAASLDDSKESCDKDGVLDNVEIGRLTVTLKNVGGTTLTETTATVSSTNPHVSFPNGGTIHFPASLPFHTMTGTVDVALDGATGIELATFTIAATSPVLAASTTSTFTARVNTDTVASAASFDDVESAAVVWTMTGDPTVGGGFPWRRLEVGPDVHRWFGPNAGAPSDESLVSPVLHVGPGNFSFTFRHRFSFEAGSFDGGVIEISKDGGATWLDIGASASPGYNGTLVSGGDNPLQGRKAYVNASAGYAAGNLITVTVSLGTTYAEQDVRVRFRTGADNNSAAVGWEVDDITFNGITNTPFPALVAHQSLCTCPSITLSPATLPAGGKDVPYPPTTLTPGAGFAPFTFAVAGLPSGMTSAATSNDVTIGGTPTVNFSGPVTVSGADRFACSFSQAYALVIGAPSISIGDVSLAEGQKGFTDAVFTVTLSHPSAVPVSVVYATSNGTADHGTDYLPEQGAGHTLTIPALDTTGTIAIRVKGDTRLEPNETFFVTLSRPVNATLGDAQGVATIVNDDLP
jgi:hypothetical protein